MAAKKTTKKVAKKAAKKVAKKADAQGKSEPTTFSSFNLFEEADRFSGSVNKSMLLLEKRKGRVVDFSTQGDLKVATLPLRSFQMQVALKSFGIPKGYTEIIGRDYVGKSSLLYSLLSGCMLSNSPCLAIYGDAKPLPTLWALRCSSPDVKIADAISRSIHILKASSLPQMAEYVQAWVEACRDEKKASYVPKHIPLVIAIEATGKFATPGQISGLSAYGGADKESETEIGDRGHNWDRAKWMHDWMPRLNVLAAEHNVSYFFTTHQNEGGVAGGAPKSNAFLQPWQVDAGHRTKPGGQALNQNAGVQIILVSRGYYYSAGVKVARRIMGKVYKNSFGGGGGEFFFALKEDNYVDVPGVVVDQGLRWDYADVDWLASNNLLGVRLTGSSLPQWRYSSDELGWTQLTLEEAAAAWRKIPTEKIEELGRRLEIPGYVDLRERIMNEVSKQDTLPAVTASEDLPPPPPENWEGGEA